MNALYRGFGCGLLVGLLAVVQPAFAAPREESDEIEQPSPAPKGPLGKPKATDGGAAGGSEKAPAAKTKTRFDTQAPLSSRLVPKDAMAVGLLRLETLQRPDLKPLLTAANEAIEPFGLKIEQLKQVSFMLTAERGEVLVFFAKAPIDWPKIVTASGDKLKETEVDGKKLLVASEAGSRFRQSFWIVDDKTLVCGEQKTLAKLAKTRSEGPELSKQWGAACKSDAAVFVRSELLGLPPVQPESPLLPLWPLQEDIRTLTAGLYLIDGETLRFDVVAGCVSSDEGKRAEMTLRSVQQLANNYLLAHEVFAGAALQKESTKPLDKATLDRKTILWWLPRLLVSSARIGRTKEELTATTAIRYGGDLIPSLMELVARSRGAARRNMSMNNMRQLALALHNYHDANGHFPPAVVIDKTSGVPRSWRVEILPFLEEQALYSQYRKNEPWDSENNKKVLAKIPSVFQHPMAPSTSSAYFAPVGKSTILGMPEGAKMSHVTDGLSKTILLVEAKRDIPWTKPEDIAISDDTAKPLPKFGGYDRGVPVVMGDGSVTMMRPDAAPDKLRALLSRNGGEVSDIDEVRLD